MKNIIKKVIQALSPVKAVPEPDPRAFVDALDILEQQKTMKGTIPLGVAVPNSSKDIKEGTIPLSIAVPDFTRDIIDQATYTSRYHGKEIRLKHENNTAGVIVMGTTGSGKGLFFSSAIAQSYVNGDRGLIYDKMGDEYFGRFFNVDQDILLNFCDARCQHSWNFFDEINSHVDIEAISKSVASVAGSEPFWVNAMSDIFAGAIIYCIANDKRTPADLWDFLTSPISVIKEALDKTDNTQKARRYFEDPESKMCQSAMSALVQQVQYLPLLSGDDKKPFNIDKWLESNNGFIYLTNPYDVKYFGGVNTLFIDTLCRKLQAKEQTKMTRMFLDEFTSLNPCVSLIGAINSRDMGLSVFLGLQTISQLARYYGKYDRDVIIAGCLVKVIFKLGDEETAKYFSDYFGEYTETHKYGGDVEKHEHDGTCSQKQRITLTKKYIMPGQFVTLQPRHAIVIQPGFSPTITHFPIVNRPEINKPRLVLRDDLTVSIK